MPLIKTQEVLIVGWRPGEGRRLGLLGSVLVAIYDEHDRLTYAGKVGTGFTDRMLRDLEADLKPLTRSTPPVPDVPRADARTVRWVEPVLIGEVAFRNWTSEGRLRAPSWRGLRNDRSVSSVRRAAEPIPYPPQGEVIGAYETANRRWRVEAIKRGRNQFYRLIHGDNVVDGLAIATVERMLAEAGVDMADLVNEGAAPERNTTPPAA